MKQILALSLLTLSFSGFAQSQVSAVTTPHHAGTAYEVVVSGEVAKKIYDVISGNISRVQDGSAIWLNKTAAGIVCGKLQNRSQYSCSMVVDKTGINF
jgi:hypothetical protein